MRAVPRDEWRIVQRPDLRIVDDQLWAVVQARRAVVGEIARQAGSRLMRGKNAAFHSPHLFSGFLRCGVCGGAVTGVLGGGGSPRYGCVRRSHNGQSACSNNLSIRAKVADAVLLAGLQAELLRPETVTYIAERLADALNAVIDARPRQRAELERARAQAETKLRNLIAALEDGAGGAYIRTAVHQREDEIESLTRQLEALDGPLDDRLAVIPTWVRRHLEDVAGLLSESPQRAKAEFQRLGIKFFLHPVTDEGERAFLRAVGEGNFEHLAFSEYTTQELSY